jgi:hypothetical protein
MPNELPIACTLSPAALKARREQLLPGLLARADERIDLPEGVRIRFDAPDALAVIVRAIDLEQQCCRFLRFSVTIEPDGGPVWLEMTGPPGTREFIDALAT